VLNSDLEILSTSTCDYNIGDLTYNETTSDVITCGRGSITVCLIYFFLRIKILGFYIGLAISL